MNFSEGKLFIWGIFVELWTENRKFYMIFGRSMISFGGIRIIFAKVSSTVRVGRGGIKILK